MDISIKDFIPFNEWELDEKGERFCCWICGGKGDPKYIIDQATGRKYLNDSQTVVRFKCFLLTVGTPVLHSLAMIARVVYQALNLLLLADFWISNENKISYDFKGRLSDAAKRVVRIVAYPLAVVGLELSAAYGLLRPYDGRKLYASVERALCSDSFSDDKCPFLAPCFQPEPTKHFFGGDIERKDQM